MLLVMLGFLVLDYLISYVKIYIPAHVYRKNLDSSTILLLTRPHDFSIYRPIHAWLVLYWVFGPRGFDGAARLQSL